jgi:muramoyltetrapeptide carboxypeptidase LdcA involved in peptidoglycan recycling
VHCLLNFLWRHGVVSYHGGSVMVHLGRPGELHPLTAASLRAALFQSGEYELSAPAVFRDEEADWGSLPSAPPLARPAGEWGWHRADRVVTGRTWGGNLEILAWLLMADRDILPVSAYEGCVLIIETSQELPPAVEVYRILRNLGERGLLAGFAAVLVGRAKGWSFERPLPVDSRVEYAAEQRASVVRALDEYAPEVMAVFDVDFGHTDPQLIIPYGGEVTVDGLGRRIVVRY